MNILITGGAGAIGSNQAKYFLERGSTIKILDNFSTGNMDNLSTIKDRVEIIRGDIGDRTVLKKALSDVDVIIHNAAFLGVKRVIENPWGVLDTNVYQNHIFFEELLKYPIKKVVFASSSEVYGDAEEVPIDENDRLEGSITTYGVAKLLAERYCRHMFDLYGVDTCSMRYFNIYGPNQQSTPYGFVVGIFLKNALENRPLTIFGDGKQTRDFTYIDDACRAVELALGTKTKGEVFNVGTGVETSINSLAELVAKASAKKLEIRYEPARPYDQSRRAAKVDKIKKTLGWKPDVSLQEGIGRTWEWMLNASR